MLVLRRSARKLAMAMLSWPTAASVSSPEGSLTVESGRGRIWKKFFLAESLIFVMFAKCVLSRKVRVHGTDTNVVVTFKWRMELARLFIFLATVLPKSLARSFRPTLRNMCLS